MKKIIFITTLVITATAFITCSQTNEPQPLPFKDPREMTWEVDTLHYPGNMQTLMSSIAGCSPDDLWICGHAGQGRMWHYDGTDWSPINLYELQVYVSDYNDLYAYDCNNIFLAGMQRRTGESPLSKIIKYDGVNWIEQPIEGNERLQSISGDSPDNIWACGHDGLIFHYDGTSWIRDTIHAPYTLGRNFQLNSIAVHNRKTYLLANLIDEINYQDVFYFYEGSIGNWVLLDSMRIDVNNSTYRWGIGKLYASLWGKLYSTGWGVFEWDGNEWNRIIPFFNNSNPVRWMDGTSEDNLILVGDLGSAYYWDGISVYPLEGIHSYPNGPLYTAVWYNGIEAFIVGDLLDSYPQTTIVFHGK